jgi:hypothetical protein
VDKHLYRLLLAAHDRGTVDMLPRLIKPHSIPVPSQSTIIADRALHPEAGFTWIVETAPAARTRSRTTKHTKSKSLTNHQAMTVGRFEQLVGAAGDVAELEYIAALHQTGETVRRDASLQGMQQRFLTLMACNRRASRCGSAPRIAHTFLLSLILLVATDIRLFLSSRYGIIVTEKEVRDLIFGGLGGGGDSLERDGDFFDLMEVVACLLIPTLLKAAQQQHARTPLPANTVPANEKMLETVWKIMLHDVSF